MKFYFYSLITLLFTHSICDSQNINWNILGDGDITITKKDTSFKLNIIGNDSIFYNAGSINKKINISGNKLITYENNMIIYDSVKNTVFNKENTEFKLRPASSDKQFLIKLLVPSQNTSFIIIPTDSILFNIYYDAQKLAVNIRNKEIALQILKKYKIDTTNKFFSQFKDDLTATRVGSGEENIIEKSFTSSILGLDVTTLADGLAKFLVSRVKKEMAIALFDDLQEKIRDTSLYDVQKLFANTYGILDLMGDRIYDFQPYVASIRQNMEYDLRNLPTSIQGLIHDDKSQLNTILKSQKNLRYLVGNSLDLGLAIKENTHFGKALGTHNFLEYSDVNTDTAAMGALQSLQLFSEALRDTFPSDTMPYWVSKQKINTLINDPDFLMCFVGLLVEKAKKDQIKLDDNLFLHDYINNSIKPEGIETFIDFLKSLQNTISQIQDIHKKYRSESNEEAKELSVVNYFDAAGNMMETGQKLWTILRPNAKPKIIDTVFSIASNITGVIKYTSVNKYSLAAMHLGKLFEPLKAGKAPLIKTIAFIADKSIFIAQLAEAKTSDEVKEVIESFAAPVGSWRDKRTARTNLALDSYVGPGYIRSDKKDDINRLNSFQISTPVGLSLSFQIGKNRFPLTFMASAIDIGPLTAKRFVDDTASIGKIYLKEIIAPGIHGSFAFIKKFIGTINLGYQRFPLLKKIGEVDLIHKSGFSGSVNVNIPILTLLNIKQKTLFITNEVAKNDLENKSNEERKQSVRKIAKDEKKIINKNKRANIKAITQNSKNLKII